MSDDKSLPPPPPGAQGKVPNKGEDTGRIERAVAEAVHQETLVNWDQILPVLRRWLLIASTVATGVWFVAGYAGTKANAKDVETLKTTIASKASLEDVEKTRAAIQDLTVRISSLEEMKRAVERIENQVYQLALRSGAPVVTKPSHR